MAFLATNTATYPLVDSIVGTTTAGSSATATTRGIMLESVVIESVGGADGTVTISDHAGGNSFALPIVLLARADFHYGPYGMELKGFLGIRAVTSDATAKVRILIRWGS